MFGGLEVLDLGRVGELLRRIQELLALGGVTIALVASVLFVGAWAASHARRPGTMGRPVLAWAALAMSYVPVGLTVVAAVAALVPGLGPYVLRAFALAVLFAGVSWCLAIGGIVRGNDRPNLARCRRALLLAGTPWYCLALYLSTLL